MEDSDLESRFERSMEELQLKRERPQVGQKIKGKVVLVGQENIFLDIGLKKEAYAERGEFESAGQRIPQVGEEIELCVISTKGEIRLGRALRPGTQWDTLKEAFRSGVPVEGKVMGTRKGGFSVSLGGKVGFCPISQISLESRVNPESHIGKTYRFRILEMDSRGEDIVLSRKEVLLEELRERQRDYLKELRQNSIVRGKVKSITPYGAFVEIGPSLQGLLHIRDMAWYPPNSAEELLRPEQEIDVMIKELIPHKEGRFKISLSLKDLTPDPWEGIEKRLSLGDVVKAKVKRLMPYGAFVEAEGIEGLVHLSEMSYIRRIQRPEEILSVGQEIRVAVKALDPAQRKASFSLRDVEGDPWADVGERYRPNQKLTGTVTKRLKRGYLISLEPGVTGYLSMEALLEGGGLDSKGLREGEEVGVEIVEVKLKERRISLKPAREEGYEPYLPGGETKLGSLGEYLKKALDERHAKAS
ncbi:MAG: S1 RNA-binding domain-containing protein [Desulfatiglandales bacterium]